MLEEDDRIMHLLPCVMIANNSPALSGATQLAPMAISTARAVPTFDLFCASNRHSMLGHSSEPRQRLLPTCYKAPACSIKFVVGSQVDRFQESHPTLRSWYPAKLR